jgi:LPXTG-motif cell wall-anchored protein
VDGTAQCPDAKGNWKIDWKFGNDFKFDAVIARDGLGTEEGLPVTGDIAEPGKVIPAFSDRDKDKQVAGSTQVGPTVDKVTVVVKMYWAEDDFLGKEPVRKTVSKRSDCSSNPPEQPAPGEPTPILEQDCTTITIGLDNPANGKEITLKFKTSKGETRTTVIKAGQKKTEKFSAVPGFTVTVTAEGLDDGTETIAYQKPADCDDSGSGGGLPVTGAAAGSIAGGAILLLAVGGALFFLSRRRKVKFTA